jgi:outer membrane protein TolC
MKRLFPIGKHNRTWSVLGTAALLGLCSPLGATPEATNTDALPELTQEERFMPLGMLLDGNGGRPRPETLHSLQQLMRDGANSGAWDKLQIRQVALIAPEQAASAALEKNLTLRSQTRNLEKTTQAIQEAQAIFKPTFQVKVGYNAADTFTRYEYGKIYVRNFVAFQNEKPPSTQTIDGANRPFDPEAVVYRFGYIQLLEDHPRYITNFPNADDDYVLGESGAGANDYKRKYKASNSKTTGPDKEIKGTLTVSQMLPWGPVLTLSQDVSWKKYESGHNTRGYYPNRYTPDPHFFDGPWGTNFTLSAWIPLPYAKHSGPDNIANSSVKKAKIAREQSDWILKGAINTILLQVDTAYWELVRSVEQLMVAVENRRFTEQQVAHTRRMFDIGRVTKLGLSQMDAEQARAQVSEEAAREKLLTASNNLSALIEDDPEQVRNVLLLPTGFDHRLRTPKESHQEYAVQVALTQRPELKVSGLRIQSGQVDLNQAQNQARPDLSANVSYGHQQTNSTYGYPNIGEALSEIANPDVRTFNASLGYVRTWGNRAARAARDRSQAALMDTQLNQEDTQQNVVKEVSDAVTSLSSARSRIEMTRQAHELANQALEKAQTLRQGLGTISELEVILKLRDVVNTRAAQVNALLDSKLAESQLLAAQGTLPEALAIQQSAGNPMEQQRVQMVGDESAASFFTSPEIVQATYE